MLVHAAHFMLCTAFKSSPSEKEKPTHLFLFSYEMCFTQHVTQHHRELAHDAAVKVGMSSQSAPQNWALLVS